MTTYYSDYLKLNLLLAAQEPVTTAHDEMLFLITHQAYELWFRQIHHELDWILAQFSQQTLAEKTLSTVVARMQRILEVQKLLLAQIPVLETMTPMDFLDFRDKLTPASGFQSVQFKLLEIKMGLRYEDRIIPFLDAKASISEKRQFFVGRLSPVDQQVLAQQETLPNLWEQVQLWLERMPFAKLEGFDFWSSYRKVVDDMLQHDEDSIQSNSLMSAAEKQAQQQQLARTKHSFYSLWDKEKHEVLVAQKQRRLSQQSLFSALFISLYRDEPILTLPFSFLNAVIELDENFTKWRYNHALMVHRIVGSKIGTGGSSGHDYLKASVESSRIFIDLFNLPTYMLPKSLLPKLPESLKNKLGFAHEVTGV